MTSRSRRITAQFLAYVEGLKQTEVDAAADFIYVASLLIHIKSRMLLPRASAEGTDGEQEDPRRELVERLLEHERFKNAAQMLLQKQQIEAATWTNPAIRQFSTEEGSEPEIAADTVDLVRVFREILDRARQRPVLDVDEEAVTVSQMLDYIRRRLIMEEQAGVLKQPAPKYPLGAGAHLHVSGSPRAGAPAGHSAETGQQLQRGLHQEARVIRVGNQPRSTGQGRLALTGSKRRPQIFSLIPLRSTPNSRNFNIAGCHNSYSRLTYFGTVANTYKCWSVRA